MLKITCQPRHVLQLSVRGKSAGATSVEYNTFFSTIFVLRWRVWKGFIVARNAIADAPMSRGKPSLLLVGNRMCSGATHLGIACRLCASATTKSRAKMRALAWQDVPRSR